MSKEFLSKTIENIQNSTYSWNLYFFRMDKRNNNPFTAYKVKFKNTTYLPDYAKNLLDTTKHFQIDTISSVQDYDGENTKVSCDKILLDNQMIYEQWNNLVSAVASATDEKFRGKIMGYILCATPKDINEDNKNVVFVKIANPIIEMKNRRTVAYVANGDNDELDMITDDVYRLYLTVDYIVIDNSLYLFNHSFEKMFCIESALKKNRDNAVEEIIQTDAFADKEIFKQYASGYKSHRTFITMKKERVEKIKTPEGRRDIAEKLHIQIDDNGKFVFTDEKQAWLLIKYLCYKIIKDDETKDLLEVGTVVKVEV